jgi:D-inositol-3-phosphate glycosyltransferase
VIASDVGGLPYVVSEGKSGLLVPGHDAGAYATRLLTILTDPLLARRLSVWARAHASRYSWDVTTERMRSIYEELSPTGNPSLRMTGALAP